MVHLFLVLMEIYKNQLLPMRPVLLFPQLILLFQKVFPLILPQNNIQEGTVFVKENFKNYIPPNRNLTPKELLYVIHEHKTKRNLAMIKK